MRLTAYVERLFCASVSAEAASNPFTQRPVESNSTRLDSCSTPRETQVELLRKAEKTQLWYSRFSTCCFHGELHLSWVSAPPEAESQRQGIRLGARTPGCLSQPGYWPAVWSWLSHLPSATPLPFPPPACLVCQLLREEAVFSFVSTTPCITWPELSWGL